MKNSLWIRMMEEGMRKTKHVILGLIFACFSFLPSITQKTAAYDDKVHIKITNNAISNSNLDDYLKQQLGFLNGIKRIVNNQEIGWWIEYGGEAEDYGKLGKNDFTSP